MSLLISFCCMGDVKKPNLNWENEADVCKNNSRGMIMFLVLFFGSGALIFVAMQVAASEIAIMMIAAAVLVINLVGAILCYQNLMKAADELPELV